MNMMKLDNRNKDITRAVIIRDLIRILAIVSWYIIFIPILIVISSMYVSPDSQVNPFFWLLVLNVEILPLILFKIYEIFDRSWSGAIVDKMYGFEPEDKNGEKVKYVEIHIRKDDLTTITVKFSGEQYELGNEYYIIGDKITHYKGCKYLYNDSSARGKNICIVCGHLNHFDNEKCEKCRTSIVSNNVVI